MYTDRKEEECSLSNASKRYRRLCSVTTDSNSTLTLKYITMGHACNHNYNTSSSNASKHNQNIKLCEIQELIDKYYREDLNNIQICAGIVVL